MTDEQTTDQPDNSAASNVETKVLSMDESAKLAAFRYRKLFADAQEQFTAGEFVEANRSLREIPEDARGADVQRLAMLVAGRIREVAELRSAVQAALNQAKHDDLQPKLLRLLELQPGDEWANTIRHRIEEEQHAREAEKTDRELIFSRPTEVPRDRRSEVRSQRSEAGGRQESAIPAGPTGIEIVDDDELDEAWEFGERLVQPAPPPLKRPVDRPPSKKPAHAPADYEDDFVGWLEPEPSSSSPGMWIAIAVSGVVILLALIATIVVLLVERGT